MNIQFQLTVWLFYAGSRQQRVMTMTLYGFINKPATGIFRGELPLQK